MLNHLFQITSPSNEYLKIDRKFPTKNYILFYIFFLQIKNQVNLYPLNPEIFQILGQTLDIEPVLPLISNLTLI